MSFEPERPAKRRKIDENSEEPEVRQLPYMASARILLSISYSWYFEGIFLPVACAVSYLFFTLDEHE